MSLETSDLGKILPLLLSDQETDRIQGLLDLLRIKDHSPLELVFRLATEDPSSGVRYYARRAFEALKTPLSGAAENRLPSATDRNRAELEKGLGSLDPKQRLASLQTALANPSPLLVPVIALALQRESVPENRAGLVMAIGRMGASEEVDLLAKFLDDRDPRVRSNAVMALSCIGTEEAVVHIIPLVQDTDHRVKAAATQALANVEGSSIPDLLRHMALEGEIWKRDAALHALGSIEAPFATWIIGEMVRGDPLQRLREKARTLLFGKAAAGIGLAKQILDRLPPVAAIDALKR